MHCLVHSLNLCPRRYKAMCSAKRCNAVYFYLVQLIKFSRKRSSLFNCPRKEVALNSNSESPLTPTLRTLCPTQWTVRHCVIYSILLNYKVLQNALDDIQTGNDKYASKASGLLSRMETFDN